MMLYDHDRLTSDSTICDIWYHDRLISNDAIW